MKRLGPLTHYVTFWSGLVIVTAMMALALWSPSARRVGAAALVATVVGMASTPVAAAENTDTAIRPFKVKVPDADLVDLRRRIGAMKWPEPEPVSDASQGVQLSLIHI